MPACEKIGGSLECGTLDDLLEAERAQELREYERIQDVHKVVGFFSLKSWVLSAGHLLWERDLEKAKEQFFAGTPGFVTGTTAGATAGKLSGKTMVGATVVKATGLPASVGPTFLDWGLDIYEATHDPDYGFE